MIGRNILDRDVIIFQYSDFNYVENGKIVAIEKYGDEEEMGAWSLKRLVIEPPSLLQPRSQALVTGSIRPVSNSRGSPPTYSSR
jgi:hypothetical protein